MCELKDAHATNFIDDQKVAVPRIDIFICGFVCKDKSKLNSARSKFSKCVQNASGTPSKSKQEGGLGSESLPSKTAETFEHVRAYVAQNRPTMLILENVPEFANRKKEKNEKGSEGKSDLDDAIEKLEAVGYAVSYNVYNAEQLGSLAKRPRLWIVGILRAEAGDKADAMLRHCHALMGEVRIPQLDYQA
eukprot:3885091-Pyramimonas_sp.AAC.1